MAEIFHIYNRGVNRAKIFSSPENYRFLLRRVQQYLPDYQISIIAYCLMPNHYHFLIREFLSGDKSRFIQRLFNCYTQAFNRQERRTGTLFEGRMRSKIVTDELYLYELIRYIHLNPVRAGLAVAPAEWLHSSHLEWVRRSRTRLCDSGFRRTLFPSIADYNEFLALEPNRFAWQGI